MPIHGSNSIGVHIHSSSNFIIARSNFLLWIFRFLMHRDFGKAAPGFAGLSNAKREMIPRKLEAGTLRRGILVSIVAIHVFMMLVAFYA